MSHTFEKLQELNLTRDEINRIGDALKKEEFRKMLADYVEEIQDPENRRIYESEIAQLERERGNDVTFIHPHPGYVIKTSINGDKKCFVNVCYNELIDRPTSQPTVKGGSKGLQWSLPHSVTPGRDDLDNKNVRCVVYDVVFHPDTLHLARSNKAFRNMVNNTAIQAIESNYDVKLDGKNLKFPKLQYKGVARASIRRIPSKNPQIVERTGEEKELYDKIYSCADTQHKKPKKSKSKTDDKSKYTTPKYTLKHRSHTDLQECTGHKEAKINAAIPKELVLEVNLPLLKSSGDITLDVTEKTVQLVSEEPAKYKLNITLPYPVNENTGNAKFDKDQKKLIVTLPVKRNMNLLLTDSVEDSGVDSDNNSPVSTESDEENTENKQLVSELSATQFRTKFLDENVSYTVPEFTCHLYQKTLAFTLNVKNVDESSVGKLVNDAGTSLHIKFTSVSSSFYPSFYAFYVRLPEHKISQEIQVETWDNNVILQIPVTGNSDTLTSYLYGPDENNLKQTYIQEPSIINELLQEDKPLEVIIEQPEQKQQFKPEEPTKAIDIASSYYSSGDEQSCSSYSPSKSKGILKRLSQKRFSVVRSISESSLDDFVPSSLENCHTSLDSVIPEDSEVSTSLKKTVRFNDNIKRQLYRYNIYKLNV